MAATGTDSTLEQNDSTIKKLIHLQKRASDLVAEFNAFSEYLRNKAKYDEVEMRLFRRGLEAEVEGLAMVICGKQRSHRGVNQLSDDEAAAKRERLLQTSNVPHYEIWWSLAKKCKGVRGLGRRVVLDGCDGRRRIKGRRPHPQQGQEIQVDIVSDDGQEWIKISAMSEKRLVFEMAKEGWERYGDFSDSEEDIEIHNAHTKKSGERRKLELLRVADALRAASQTVRSRYKHPRVRFVLPRLAEGHNADIDALLADLRATGAIVECGVSATPPAAPASLEIIFARMLPTATYPPLTPSLNIDCSILIAMISDQCHTPPSQLPNRPLTPTRTYHAAILQQMAEEEADPLLPNTLYPLLVGRELTCTSEAANRMLNIVSMMGTVPERSRAAIILGRDTYSSHSQPALIDALGSLSSHSLPTPPNTISLPIRVIDITLPSPASISASYPDFRHAHIFARLLQTTKLSALNAAVLLFGWSQDVVTLTSNQTAVNQVERGLGGVLDELEREQKDRDRRGDGEIKAGGSRRVQDSAGGGNGDAEAADAGIKDLEAFQPPKFWVMPGCRSLVGKEKEKRAES